METRTMPETLKIQSHDPSLGWVHSTRTAMPYAWAALAGYRRDYPSTQHRLVSVADDGAVTVIPDDADALALAAELHE